MSMSTSALDPAASGPADPWLGSGRTSVGEYGAWMPRLGPPRPARVWVAPPGAAAPRPVLAVAAGVGLLAAGVLRPSGVGGGWLLLATVALMAVHVAARRVGMPLRWPAAGACIGAMVLPVAGLLRDADWLVALCLLGALALAGVSVAPARTWTGLTCAAGLLLPAAARSLPWAARGATGLPRPRLSAARLRLTAVTVTGLAVFFGLFRSADAAYAELTDRLLPQVSLGGLPGRMLLGLLWAGLALGLAHLALHRPRTDELAPRPPAPIAGRDWTVPLVLLDLLFVSFVIVQAGVLFGGRNHVLATGGLTYAEYARSGFWQLLLVTVLVLAVLAAAVRFAPTATFRDRLLVRALLGVLCVCALVVVASAERRMSLYEQEYGYTRLRLAVHTVEVGLGAVLVLVLAAGVRLRAAWLPRAVAGLVTVGLLGAVAADPDAWIAERSVDRFAATGRIDTGYLSGLSGDAVPALATLPAPQRGCALARIARSLDGADEPWHDPNLSRSRARDLLADLGPLRCDQSGLGGY